MTLTYRVTPARPEAHLFACELLIPAGAGETLTLRLPAWIPGSYMIRDFARNIISLTATQAGAPVGIAKLDKQTWRLSGVQGPVTVRWEVYAWELSVRSAHLDQTHGYFNGSGLLLAVDGLEQTPCRLELVPPTGDEYHDWRVATSLEADGAAPWGFGAYRAADYADLIDHPVEMGQFAQTAFSVEGVPHHLVLTGRQRADLPRLAADLAQVCAEHAALFGELPVDRYLFLTMVVGAGYGGLEHRDSTSLLVSRADLPLPGAPAGKPTDGYRRLLGLMSHEYFHLWHVKRIRPQALMDGGLDREVHTRTLWAFEGITSYYDDLALVRCGLIDANTWLGLLAEGITRVLRTPGRHRQSVAESSFDAWTKFYKADDNAPNAMISYYAKGALVALSLDLTIRHDSAGAYSLDTVMRALWQRHGRTGLGVGERGIEALATEVTGCDLAGFFAIALDGTADLDLAGLFATVGIELALRPGRGGKDAGGVVERFEPVPEPPRLDLGLRLTPERVEAEIASVLDARPAQRAGLAGGDVIVAVDGLKTTAANLEDLVARLPPGVAVPVHAFRRDELMRFTMHPEPAPADTCELRLDPSATPAALAQRAAWLASVQVQPTSGD